MPREARLFSSSAGSAVRAYLKFRANIPPRWIKNARHSRKRIEPEIVAGLRSFKQLKKTRPRARVAIRNSEKELKLMLQRWEIAYNKENFYRGIRVLLELQRNGASNL
jgi:ADP-dependent phosphofructokinase/glucokinase